MKYNKVLSLTLTNGLLLLAFASILASCQKKSIHKNGLFSQYESQQTSRSIASFKPKKESVLTSKFERFQDPKQIHIYCSLNAVNVEQCYKIKLSKSLKRFIQVEGPISKKEYEGLSKDVSFAKVDGQVKSIKTTIRSSLESKIQNLVTKRYSFCQNNSKIDFQRCLGQYVERDTFAVLNAFQLKQTKMNGHEYLYLKKMIQMSFEAKLMSLNKKI